MSASQPQSWTGKNRAPKEHISTRILQQKWVLVYNYLLLGLRRYPLILGLGNRLWDHRCVYLVAWAPKESQAPWILLPWWAATTFSLGQLYYILTVQGSLFYSEQRKNRNWSPHTWSRPKATCLTRACSCCRGYCPRMNASDHTSRLIPYPFFVNFVLGLAPYSFRVGYPLKGVWYERAGS